MVSIEKQISYISKNGLGNFVKYKNTEDFLELDTETREFLKDYGIYSYEYTLPALITDGLLKKYNDDLIFVGYDDVNQKYCININTKELVLVMANNKQLVVNSSIQKLIEAQYTLNEYIDKYESKEVLGEYQLNHKKYAQKLKEMLEVVESNIMQYPIWANRISERELGTI